MRGQHIQLTAPLLYALHQVLYSNDRLADDNAVVEAEKTRKKENERDKEHKRIRYTTDCAHVHTFPYPLIRACSLSLSLFLSLWPCSDEAKIKAIQAKLALMKQETPSSSSSTSSTGAASGKQPSSYSTRNTGLRDRPY
jgi:hypothetical protein